MKGKTRKKKTIVIILSCNELKTIAQKKKKIKISDKMFVRLCLNLSHTLSWKHLGTDVIVMLS